MSLESLNLDNELQSLGPINLFEQSNVSEEEDWLEKIKRLTSKAIEPVEDFFDVGDIYKENRPKYDEMFRSPDIVKFGIDENNNKILETANTDLLEQTYRNEIEKILNRDNQGVFGIDLEDTEDFKKDAEIFIDERKNLDTEDFSEKNWENSLLNPHRNMLSRFLRRKLFLKDETAEELNALMDSYREISNSMSILTKRQKQKGNLTYNEYEDEDSKETLFDVKRTAGSLLGSALQVVGDVLGTSNNFERQIKNSFENVFRFYAGEEELPVDNVNFFEYKDALTKTLGKEVNSLPEQTPEQQEHKQKMLEEYKKLTLDDDTSVFWAGTIDEAADLMGSMISPLGRFGAGSKIASLGIEGAKSATKVLLANRMARIEKILGKFDSNPKAMNDVRQLLEQSPKLTTRARLMWESLKGKDLSVGELVLPGLKNILGSGTENIARMTIAAGISNALDMGMTDDEAFEASKNMMFLSVGNEAFGRLIGGALKGAKLINAAGKGLGQSGQRVLSKEIETLYQSGYLIGSFASQGVANSLQGLDINSREYWGEMLLNAIFGWNESAAAIRARNFAKRNKSTENFETGGKIPEPQDLNPNTHKAVPFKGNIKSIKPDQTVVAKDGQLIEYLRIDTPGNLVENFALKFNKNIDNLILKDVGEFVKQTNDYQDQTSKSVYEQILNQVGDKKINILDNPNGLYAYYTKSSDAITFNKNVETSNFNTKDLYDAIIEEGLHAITVNKYDTNSKFKTLLDNAYNKVTENLDLERASENLTREEQSLLKYHTSNPHEFVALLLNKRLKKVKEELFKQTNIKDVEKSILTPFKNKIKEFLGKDVNKDEINTVLEKIVNSEIKPIDNVQEEINQNTGKSLLDKLNARQSEKQQEDIFNDFDELFGVDPLDDYGMPTLSMLNNRVKDVNVEPIQNKINTLRQLTNKKYTPEDLVREAESKLMKDEFTQKELEEFLDNKISNVKLEKERYKKIEESLKENMIPDHINDFNNFYEKINDDNNLLQESYPLKELFSVKNVENVYKQYVGKDFQDIKKGLINELSNKIENKDDIDIISDFYSNYLSNLKEYKTLMLNANGTLEPNNLSRDPKGKSLKYYDGASNWNKFKNFFNIDETFYTNETKQLLDEFFGAELQAITYADHKVSNILNGYISGKKYDNFITNNLAKGYYMVPRGTKELSVIEIPSIRNMVQKNDNKGIMNVARNLHKGNFYKYLQSDLTWNYSSDKIKFDNLAQFINHKHLYDVVNGKELILEKLITDPSMIKEFAKKPEIIDILINKATDYYRDDVGGIHDISHLFKNYDNLKHSLLLLDNELTNTMEWGLDPAGKARVVKYDFAKRESYVAKNPWKYEGVGFGRSPKQINKVEIVEKLMGAKNKSLEDKNKIASEYGLTYKNNQLYEKILVVDPRVYENTPFANIFREDKTDGGSLSVNNKSHELKNKMMFNQKNYNILKPRHYYPTDEGNAIIFKTANFNHMFDKHSENYNNNVVDYYNKLGSNISTLTFNSSLKSGHTKKYKRFPSSIEEGSYIKLNALNQIIGAETNGKDNPELYEKEFQLYKEEILSGNISNKYILELPLTGEDAINLLEYGHELKTSNSGALGINNSPLFHKDNDFFQGEKGQEAFNIMQEYINNVQTFNIDAIEGYIALRNSITMGNGGLVINESYNGKKIGKLFKYLAKELDNIPEGDKSFTYIENIGRDNLKELINSAVTKDGELKRSHLFAFLSMDRFLTAPQGQKNGANSILFHTIKRLYEDAVKVRGYGGRGIVMPDIEGQATISRLLEYELSKTDNPIQRERLIKKSSKFILNYIDPETKLYKAYSQGASFSKDVIDKLGLKIGDKIFLKLTPSDDLHSIVPVVVTGMNNGEGNIVTNSEYLTKILGRDFDKDAMEIWLPGMQIDNNKFETLWDYYTEQGMHTGKYKDGIEKYYEDEKKISGDKKAISLLGPEYISNYIKNSPRYAQFARNTHLGQGNGIFLRNQFSQILQNSNQEYPLSKDDAKLVSYIITKFVDSYDYTPFDKIEALKQVLKMTAFDGDKYVNVNKKNASDLKNLLEIETKAVNNTGLSSNFNLFNIINTKKFNINNKPEEIRNTLIEFQQNNLINNTTKFYETKYPELKNVIKETVNELIGYTIPLNKALDEKSIKASFKNIDIRDENVQKFKGLFFNYINENYDSSYGVHKLGIIDKDKPVMYKYNELRPYIEYQGRKIQLNKIFDEEGRLGELDFLRNTHIINNLIELYKIPKLQDNHKASIIGKFIAEKAKDIAGDTYDKGEIAAAIAFTKTKILGKETSVALPGKGATNSLPAGRYEISDIQASIQDSGIKPLIDGLSPQEYVFNKAIEQSEILYGSNDDIFGMPVSSKLNRKTVTEEIGNKLLGVDFRTNINELQKSERDAIEKAYNEAKELLIDYAEQTINPANFDSPEARKRFIERLEDKLSYGEFYKQRLYFQNENRKNVIEGNPITKAMKFAEDISGYQYLENVIQIIEDAKKVKKDKLGINFSILDHNIPAEIIAKHSKDVDIYSANTPLTVHNEYKNGERVKTYLEEINEFVELDNFETVIHQVDRNTLTNKMITTLPRAYVKHIAPLKNINSTKDLMVKNISTILNQSEMNYLNTSLNTDKLTNFAVIDDVLNKINVNTSFQKLHKTKSQILFQNKPVNSSDDLYTNYIDYVKTLNLENTEERKLINFIGNNKETLYSLAEINKVMVETSDYFKDLKDKINFYQNNLEDAFNKEMINTITININELISKYQKPTLSSLKKETRKLEITELDALNILESYLDKSIAAIQIQEQLKVIKNPDKLATNEIVYDYNEITKEEPIVQVERSEFVAVEDLPNFVVMDEKYIQGYKELQEQGWWALGFGNVKTILENAYLNNESYSFEELMTLPINRFRKENVYDYLNENYKNKTGNTLSKSVLKQVIDLQSKLIEEKYSPDNVLTSLEEKYPEAFIMETPENQINYVYESTETPQIGQFTTDATTNFSDYQEKEKQKSELKIQARKKLIKNKLIKNIVQKYKNSLDEKLKFQIIRPYVDNQHIVNKTEIDAYDLLEIIAPETNFSYSLENLMDNVKKKGEIINYELNKIALREYNKRPDPNNAVANIFRGEFAQNMGKDYIYTRSLNREEIRANFDAIKNGNDIIKTGSSNIFAYIDADATPKQGIGKFLGTVSKNNTPYFVFLDDTSKSDRLYTIAASNLINITSGDYAHTLTKLDKAPSEKYYSEFFNKAQNDISSLLNKLDPGMNKVKFYDDKKTTIENIVKEHTGLKTDINNDKGSYLAQYTRFAFDKALTYDTYFTGGALGKFITAGAVSFASPAAGISIAGIAAAKWAQRFIKLSLSNIYGTTQASNIFGHTNSLKDEMMLPLRSIKDAINVNRIKSNEMLGAESLAPLEQGNKNNQLDYLSSTLNNRRSNYGETISNYYKNNKESESRKKIFKEIDNIIKSRYNNDPDYVERLQNDEGFKKLVKQAEELKDNEGNPGRIEFSNGIPFINGQPKKSIPEGETGLFSTLAYMLSFKGFLQEMELQSLINANKTGQLELQRIAEDYRKIDNNTIKFNQNFERNFIQTWADITKGNFSSTIMQKGTLGRALLKFSHFNKGGFIASTKGLNETRKMYRDISLMAKNDENFKSWYKEKTSIPYGFGKLKPGSYALAIQISKGAIMSLLAGMTAGAFNDEWGMDKTIYTFGINTLYADLMSLFGNITWDIVRSDSKGPLGPKTKRNLSDVTPGGVYQKEALDLFYTLGTIGWYNTFVSEGGKRRAVEKGTDKMIKDATAKVIALPLPGTSSTLKPLTDLK